MPAADRSAQVMTLPDGRALGYAETGPPDADVVVVGCHGTPGCRLSRWPEERPFIDAGVRLVTFDRPGYGRSDRLPGRRVVDVVPDVEALVDSLGVDRFAATGGSGGGPHALALAARLGERVVRAHCEVGVAPIDAIADWTAGMDPENVKEFRWARQGEAVLARELAGVATDLLARVERDPTTVLGDFELPEADRDVLADRRVQRMVVASTREALGTGVCGWVDDDLAFVSPWGFDVAEIEVPVLVRYGASDVLTPAAHGAWLAEHVPGAEVVVATSGHLGGDPAEDVRRTLHWARTGVWNAGPDPSSADRVGS